MTETKELMTDAQPKPPADPGWKRPLYIVKGGPRIMPDSYEDWFDSPWRD